jgi:hypothetical protein
MCGLTMNTVQGLTATFNLKQARVMAPAAAPAYFNTLAAAYAATPTGAILQAQATTFPEALIFNQPILLTLEGGRGVDYLTTVGVTTVQGSLTISNGQVIIRDVVIR